MVGLLATSVSLLDANHFFSDPAMLRKVVFMFNSLMIDNAKFGEALLKTDIWEYLNNVLDKYPEDEDMAEKVNRERGHLERVQRMRVSHIKWHTLGIANSPHALETGKWQCTSRLQDTCKESCRYLWKGTPWIG